MSVPSVPLFSPQPEDSCDSGFMELVPLFPAPRDRDTGQDTLERLQVSPLPVSQSALHQIPTFAQRHLVALTIEIPENPPGRSTTRKGHTPNTQEAPRARKEAATSQTKKKALSAP